MKDPCTGIRKKIRAIAEIRYPATPSIFDMRGKIIESIHPQIEEYFQHWRTDLSSIIFSPEPNKSPREFIISLKRTAIVLEDIGSIQEFVDKTTKYFELMHQQIGHSITRLNRVGVRFIEICALSGADNFDDMIERVRRNFFNLPADLTLDYTDNLLKIVHKNGYFQVGPTKEGEDWVQHSFSESEKNIPKAGIGLDIDSFSTDITINTSKDLTNAFLSVYKVTKSIEESLLRHMGMIDE